MSVVPLLAAVALTEDLPQHGLTRGQIGTVVEHLAHEGETALLVEFSDEHGETYAMAEVQPGQLMVLHRKIEAA
jgi:ribosomal protein S4E